MQRAGYELGTAYVIPNADISAVAATSFTAARWGQNSTSSGTELLEKQAGVVRGGAASAADFWRPLGTVTIATGVFNQVGPNWSDTTLGSEDFEVWLYGVRRDQECLKSLNRVTRHRYITSMHMLSRGSGLDFGMESSTDSLWTDVLTPTTSAKSTTGTVAPYGPRSYQLTNDAANEGTRSQGIRVTQGSRASAYAIASAEAGTASFQIYDSTNSAVVGTAVTHSERLTMLMTIRNQELPSTCKAAALNMLGTTSSSDIYWNQVGFYSHDTLSMQLPSFVTESFMAPRLYRGVPQHQIAENVYDARNIDFRPLVEGQDYWLQTNHADASPYKVRFAQDIFDNPVFIEYRRPQSDLVTLSAESDTVVVPEDEILPAFKIDLLETVYNTGLRRIPDWDRQYNIAKEQLTKQTRARPIASVANPKPYWAPMLGA